jgi:hypothetical protein
MPKETITVVLSFHDEATSSERDDSFAYLYLLLEPLIHQASAFKHYRVLTDEYPNERSEQLIQSIADALWGDDADTEWNADTLDAIADAIRLMRPELITSRGGDQ